MNNSWHTTPLFINDHLTPPCLQPEVEKVRQIR